MRTSERVILQGRRTSHRYIAKGFSEGAINWVYQESSKRFESCILMVYFAFLEKSHKIYLIIKSNNYINLLVIITRRPNIEASYHL